MKKTSRQLVRRATRHQHHTPAMEQLEARALFTVTTFTLDTGQSAITASGSVAGATLTPQAAGSLVSSYSGKIDADVFGGSIKFTNASAIKANTNPHGPFKPGNLGAAYGGQIATGSGPAFIAIRNFLANISSAAALPFGAGGTFASAGELLSLTSAKVDYAGPVVGTGSLSLAGLSGNNGAAAASKLVVTANGNATLTIPIFGTVLFTTLTPNDTTLTLRGQWVATAKLSLGSIAGNVFKDINGNGARNTGDTNFAGVKVFLDKNKNGTLDTGETSTTTDTAGNYKFSNLVSGVYRVAQVVPGGGYRIAAPVSGSFDVPVAPGVNITGKTFADTRTILIAGTVFNDKNGNAARNAGEGGMGGWTLYIDTNNNKKLDTGETTTSSATDGSYKFILSPPPIKTTYLVRQVVKAGWRQTLPTSGAAQIVTLAAGGKTAGKDFGDDLV